MENKYFILGLLENVLGKGVPTKNGDYDFYCPVCKHKKRKLIVNIETGNYNCWTCHPPTKGKSPISLLKKVGASREVISEMKGYLGVGVKTEKPTEEFAPVTLPNEFISLMDNTGSLDMRHALSYLFKRGITQQDIAKYNIGYCDKGRYRGRIIVPSYNEDYKINYFIARAIHEETIRKYDTPKCKKSEIIGFANLINWDIPVILCEGAFDAMAIKRNALPLFGKTIPKAVMMKLVSHSVKTIYLALDKDALADAISSAEELMRLGKDVYLIDLQDKDPSKLGFEKFTELLHSAKQLSFETLFSIKMKMIFK